MRVAMMGSKDSGLRLLQAIAARCGQAELVGVIHPDDRTDGRCVLSAFEAYAEAQGLPFACVRSAADAEPILADWKPDVVIVLGWYYLIPVERFPQIAFYGFHYSPLPRYRGNAPAVWQLLNGEPEGGVTFFRFAPGIDEGDYLGQARFPLGPDDAIATFLAQADQAVERLLDAHLEDLLAGTAVHHRQDHSQATFGGLRVREDGLIDWRWPAERLHNFIRAQSQPYPGAFTRLPDGREVIIWRAHVHPRPYHGVPGGIAERHADHVVVTCGEGALCVTEAQVVGEAPASPRTLFTSLRMRLG